MRHLVSVLLVGSMLLPSAALAAEPGDGAPPSRATHLAAVSTATGPIAKAASREAHRLATLPRSGSAPRAQAATRGERNWIARHPMLFGAIVGFGAGFAIGYGAGDDGVFDDFTAGSNGLFLGGIGCGIGAGVGLLAAHVGGD